MSKVLIGIDVGTTSVKMVAVDSASGKTLVKRDVKYSSSHPKTGWVEQNPNDWIEVISKIWLEISPHLAAEEVIGIGICSQVNTHLLVDKYSKPLTPAISWKDLRCSSIAQQMDSAIDEKLRIKFWGGPFKIDSSFSLVRLKWWLENEPELYSQAAAVMLPKDFVIFKLTGAMVADPLSAIGVVGSDGKYISEVLALVEGASNLCAPLFDFDQIAGLTNGSLGFPPNIPVAVGTMDAVGNVFGSGLIEPSHAMEIGGTSEIVGIVSKISKPTAGVISFPAIRGRYLHAGPTQAGGDALSWLAGVHSRSIEECISSAESSVGNGFSNTSRTIFLPHLNGERAPYWNPNAQGVWLGINRETNFGELVQSVMEGVAFSARAIRERCEIAAASAVTKVRVSGGAAKSNHWNQIKADVHGVEVEVMDEIDTGARGIALVAGGAIGITKNLEEWASSLALVSSSFTPNQVRVRELEQKYQIYLESYVALLEIFNKNTLESK